MGALDRLDLDHVSTTVGEQLGGVGAGHRATELEDADALEKPVGYVAHAPSRCWLRREAVNAGRLASRWYRPERPSGGARTGRAVAREARGENRDDERLLRAERQPWRRPPTPRGAQPRDAHASPRGIATHVDRDGGNTRR